jgi:hypothetical protein
MDPEIRSGSRRGHEEDPIHMNHTIRLPGGESRFQEDKELAREVRQREILPALGRGDSVVLDFTDVEYATQSFIHALIGEVLKRYGIDILDRIEFRRCSKQLQNIISLVVNYSLGGFAEGIDDEVIRDSRLSASA